MAKDVRAGGAFIELGVRDAVDKGLKSAQKKLNKWGRTVTRAGASMAAAGAAVVTPLLATVKTFASAGDEIHKMSIRTRIAAEDLSTLKFAAEQSGTSLDAVGNAMFRATRRIGNATQQTGPAVRALGLLGMNVQALADMDPMDQMLTLADRLNMVGNEALRSQLGFEIFGDAWKQVQPLLSSGSDGIRELQQQARELGLEMSGPDAEAAAEFSDAMNELKSSFTGIRNVIGTTLIGSITAFIDKMTPMVVGVQNFIRENSGLIKTVFMVGAALVSAGTILTGLGIVLTNVAAVFGFLASAIGFLLSPIGLVIAAITALGVWAWKNSEMFRDAIQWMMDALEPFIRTIRNTVTAVTEAFATGDINKAWDIVVMGLEATWLGLTNSIRDYWDTAMNFVADAGLKVTLGIANSISALGRFLQSALDKWKSAHNWVANKTTELIGSVTGERIIGGPIDFVGGSALGDIESTLRGAFEGIETFGDNMADAAVANREQGRRDREQAANERRQRLANLRLQLAGEAERAKLSKKQRDAMAKQPTPPTFDEAGPELAMAGSGVRASTGTFSAAAAMFMGGAGTDIQERQLNEQQRTRKLNQQQLDEMKKERVANFAK